MGGETYVKNKKSQRDNKKTEMKKKVNVKEKEYTKKNDKTMNKIHKKKDIGPPPHLNICKSPHIKKKKSSTSDFPFIGRCGYGGG